jgi:hypothetical protein
MHSNPSTLTIRFAGMCLLVRGADHRLRVMLPDMRAHDTEGGHDGHHRRGHGATREAGSDRHRACLLFDPRLTVNAVGEGEGAGIVSRDLAGGVLRFPGLDMKVDPVTVKHEFTGRDVADLTELFGVRVPAGTGDSVSEAGPVIARVDVPSGKAGMHNAGAVWRLGGRDERNLAVWVEWIVPIENWPVRMVLEQGEGTKEWTLRPRTDLPTAALYIYHEPSGDLPSTLPPPDHPDDQQDDRVGHFSAFFDLVRPDVVADQPIPRRDIPEVVEPASAPKAMMGSRVTCVIASADAELPAKGGAVGGS